LKIDESVGRTQMERLERVKSTRDKGAVTNALEKLKNAAKNNENVMPATVEAVKVYATVEEICMSLTDIYGLYEEPAF
jgi:methylmalonyl-CoA mutase, N-terminal domain